MTHAKIEVGYRLAPHVVDVDPEPMKVVAALLDDPFGIHWDPVQAEAQGLGNRVVNQGPLGAAYLIDMVLRFAGDAARLRHVAIRLLSPICSGDQVRCTGVVTAVDSTAGTVTVELRGEVAGTAVLAGSALVALS